MDWMIKWRVPLLITLGVLFAGAVGAVTGYTSWGHIVHVGRMAGEPAAAYLPVSVDGMMLSGTVMASVDALRGRRPRGWAVAGMWVGSIMTVAFNVGSAWERGWLARGVALVPAVALLVTVETLFHPSQRYIVAVIDAHRAASDQPQPPESVPAAPQEASTTEAPLVPADPPAAEPAAPEPVPTGPKPRARRSTVNQPRGPGSRGGKVKPARPRAGVVVADVEVVEPDPADVTVPVG